MSQRYSALLLAILDPYGNDEALAALARHNVSSFAMELMPRITRAQVMDVLSSQANLAGYRAVIDAAAEFNRALPQMMARLPRGPAWWQTGPLPFTLALRQGPLTVLDAAIVAGHLPQGAPHAEAEAMARVTTGPGFLIAWKGWPARG